MNIERAFFLLGDACGAEHKPDLSKFGKFDGALQKWDRDRILATTDNGCCGDVICILFGSDFPFIVRQTADDVFQLIGECYVYGLMKGEALERVETGDFVFNIK